MTTKASKKADKAPVPNGKRKKVVKQYAMVAAAAPFIQTPAANSYVQPGVNLYVQIQTNRPDLSYLVTLADITAGLPVPPPPPSMRLVSAPSGTNFAVTFPGASLQPNRLYRLRVWVNPANGPTPPHMDHTINVHTRQPIGWKVITESPETPFEGYHTDEE